ncbi:basic form of pathogenesis-related protein 1-like [Rhodamnia argentea]|uniref:Pathogenesis-related protein 1 n=1 Tax=Rhodamnia argentea TaxID=178133 RepID=A0A8B8NLE9_9MYRT|nr:basic form of pathogenesis-related protein 1-like [Rhodamnia argentea]
MKLLIPSLAIFIHITGLISSLSADVSAAQSSHQDFVDEHNAARAEVGVGPIAWNGTVAAYAQKYADERIGDCNLEHSGGPYGENLAEGYGVLSGRDSVKMWVGEKDNYDYDSNSCVGGECLHYTQVVWRKSVHLGCARVKCDNGWWFVICNYAPPGNYEGERPY